MRRVWIPLGTVGINQGVYCLLCRGCVCVGVLHRGGPVHAVVRGACDHGPAAPLWGHPAREGKRGAREGVQPVYNALCPLVS